MINMVEYLVKKGTLAICTRDLHIVGFKNRSGRGHTLGGFDPIVPDSTILFLFRETLIYCLHPSAVTKKITSTHSPSPKCGSSGTKTNCGDTG